MHYYIDGYNMLFRLKHCRDNIQHERDALIIDLNQKVSLLNLDVSIVFDSTYQKSESRRTHYNQLEILYTDLGETADDFILNQLKHAFSPKNEVVVTSDKKLAFLSRHFSAKTETIEKFTHRLNSSYFKRIQFPNQKEKLKKSIKTKIILPESSIGDSIKSKDRDYLTIFEEKWLDIQRKEPEKYKRNEKKLPKETEMDRWLRLFENEEV